jgi:hypothetical protein
LKEKHKNLKARADPQSTKPKKKEKVSAARSHNLSNVKTKKARRRGEFEEKTHGSSEEKDRKGVK